MSDEYSPPPWLEPPYCTKCTWLHWPETSCMDEKLMPIPTSIAAAIIEWDRRGRLVDDESYVQNNAPVIARVLWDAVAALKQANAEICALVPMPFEGLPDFSLACPNEADRACLTNALLAIRAAIEMAEGGWAVMLTCTKCQGEGSLYTSRYGGNDPDVWRTGECPACKGSGNAECEARGCKENAAGFNDDGEALCEDCLQEWAQSYGDEP